MPGRASPLAILRPHDRRLIAAACVAQCLLIAVPALRGPHYTWLMSAALVALGTMLFSVRRTLMVLLTATIVLPDPFIDNLHFPMGLRLVEVFLMAAFAFLVVDVVYRQGLRIRPSSVHPPVLVFLVVSVFSAAVGMYHGNDGSIVLRNLRFLLYYAAVFAVVQAVDRSQALRLFAPLFALAGFVVSAEYIIEFLRAIDLSTGDRFFRVGRRQGIILPIALLFITNQIFHDPRRYSRLLLAALFVPIGLAFALTVGRGIWVAFAVGLAVSIGLRHIGQPAQTRRLWRSALLAVAMVVAVVGTVLVFQRITGTAITAQAVSRSRTFVDYSRDVQLLGRLLGYAKALEAIDEHPVLGSGQGKTLTFYSFNPDTDRYETWTSWTLDSLYLTLWLKMGLPGLLAFGWLCAWGLRSSWQTFRRSAAEPDVRAFTSWAMAVIVGNLALGVSDASMINGRFVVVFAILFGMVAVAAPRSEANSLVPTRAATS